MSYPIDLSITGKPSPRVEHPRSGRKTQTPLDINRSKSLRSNIFGENQDENSSKVRPASGITRTKRDDKKLAKVKTKSGVTSKSHNYKGSSPVITRSELECINHLTSSALINEEEEKKEYAIPGTPRKSAPKGVPQLSLDDIVGKEDMTYSKVAEKMKLQSPDPKETVSWGLRSKPKTKGQNTKGGGWQVSQSRPVKAISHKHDDVPDLDLKLSQSNEALGQLRKAVNQVDEDLQIEYIGKMDKQGELENLKKISNKKKNEILEEAVLADQLGHTKITESTLKETYSPFGASKKFNTKSKRHHDLYCSSAKNDGAKSDISQRLQFSARILSLNGHDARREISGFYFVSDKTIAMYEFRHFGTRSKALPFMLHGLYHHFIRHRVGEPFEVFDFEVGEDLIFETRNQSCLPDSLKSKELITFRVTDIDEDAKKRFLSEKFETSDRNRLEGFHSNHLSDEYKTEKHLLHSFQNAMRDKVKSHGEKVLMNLYYHLSSISHEGLLARKKYEEVLRKCNIAVENEDFDRIWEILDLGGGNMLDYGDFLRGYFGEMNEQRKAYVRKAFSRLDPTKSGEGMINDIKKYYCATKHPSFVNGNMKEKQVLEEFTEIFRPSKMKTSVSYFEFELYYEGVSMGITCGADFINLLRHTWNI